MLSLIFRRPSFIVSQFPRSSRRRLLYLLPPRSIYRVASKNGVALVRITKGGYSQEHYFSTSLTL